MSEPGFHKAYPITDSVVMVPCRIGVNGSEFLPICKPFETEKENPLCQSRKPWSPKEDTYLNTVVRIKKKKGWTAVAREINLLIHCGVPVRNGKQCRERYFNHLDPDLTKSAWTIEEDLLLLHKQQEIGNKWSTIAKLMPGRSDNQIKSRFKSLVKKANKLVPKGIDIVKWLIERISLGLFETTPSRRSHRGHP